MTESDAPRPKLQTKDTLGPATLLGTLNSDGITALHPNSHSFSSRHNGSAGGEDEDDGRLGLSDASAAAKTADKSDGKGYDAEEEAMESYDDIQPDPDTLISTRRSAAIDHRPTSADMLEEKQTAATNIQVRLDRTDKQGHYILTADDPDLRKVLKKRIEREQAEARCEKPRVRFRDLVFTRQFTTFDRRHAAAQDSPFFGFFTLFWISMVLIFIQLVLRNWRDYGSILGGNQVLRLMLKRDVLVLGLTDGVMYAATFEGLVFQKLVKSGYIDWAAKGWIIQNAWQTAYLAAVIGFSYLREWPWTHTIFVTLHGLVFVMKQHSYAFYNGYLSGVYKRRALLERKLRQLEAIEPIQSPWSLSGESRSKVSSTGLEIQPSNTAARRFSPIFRSSTNLDAEQSEVAAAASALASNQPITADQMTTLSNVIKHEIDDLSRELRGKSESGSNAYPSNLTLANMADWSVLPTLVYELEYPRQEAINWAYVAEKTAATFGVLCVMQVVSQAYIYPSVAATIAMKDSGMPLQQRWQEFPFIVSDMLFPLLIEQLLTWYLIWECILNVLAELTLFADRGFYGDWWNSVTWDQYARDWNRPVHNFLLRHVYHSSISTFHLSRKAATFVTFLLSALVHEMCMALIFNKVRGYLFWMQLMQMPLVSFSRSKFMKGRTILGNVVFWIGLFIGPSLLTSLYLIV